MQQVVSEWVERSWYSRWPLWLLLPLQPVYVLYGWLRRLAYRLGAKQAWQAPVPVLVVGNISVGGTGKTPLTIALIEAAQALQLRVGVVSRGYGRNNDDTILIGEQHGPAEVGDEPLLIQRRTGAAVAVAPKRRDAVQCLLAQTDVNFIIADDGLQHYALDRDAEVVVVDSQRGLGNGWQLPCGPLREPASRLSNADAVVINQRGGAFTLESQPALQSSMQLEGQTLLNLVTDESAPLSAFSSKTVTAIAGIGNPAVFYRQLETQGLSVKPIFFADHHAFSADDLPNNGECVIMTEKDAIKLAPIAATQDHRDCWYLPVSANLAPGFAAQLIQTTQTAFEKRRSA
jgi:tetraacyldisaccharide 4'-kinase